MDGRLLSGVAERPSLQEADRPISSRSLLGPQNLSKGHQVTARSREGTIPADPLEDAFCLPPFSRHSSRQSFWEFPRIRGPNTDDRQYGSHFKDTLTKRTPNVQRPPASTNPGPTEPHRFLAATRREDAESREARSAEDHHLWKQWRLLSIRLMV